MNATGTDRQEELQPRFEGLTREEPALQVHNCISSVCQSSLPLSSALTFELLTGGCHVPEAHSERAVSSTCMDFMGVQCCSSSSLRKLWAGLHPQLPVQPLSVTDCALFPAQMVHNHAALPQPCRKMATMSASHGVVCMPDCICSKDQRITSGPGRGTATLCSCAGVHR